MQESFWQWCEATQLNHLKTHFFVSPNFRLQIISLHEFIFNDNTFLTLVILYFHKQRAEQNNHDL